MSRLHISLWGSLIALSILWLVFEPNAYTFAPFFSLRGNMVQYFGILAMGCMSVIMILALRPRWLEGWIGGLDKMYRLHKWLGISALVLSVTHWLWAKGPKWAVGLGLLERRQRGPRPQIEPGTLESILSSLRGFAEDVGEWAFYGAAALMVLALIKWFPYRLFFKTHRLLAVTYLVLAFHAAVLLKFSYWATPLGAVMGVLLTSGVVAAVIVLLRRVARGRKVNGTIRDLRYHPTMRTLEIDVEVPASWPGHQAGQFAFAMSDPSEGPHPYTIASAWDASTPRLTFMVKELGDHTRRLQQKLTIGQPVTVEGPYGRFTFEDRSPRQIWVSGGIGLTPFLARLEQLAKSPDSGKQIDFFHCAAEADDGVIARLKAAASAAGVRLHLLVTPQDGLLDGDKIRTTVGEWQQASLWFCGPAGFGLSLRRDFASKGLNVGRKFHQELFSMR